VRIHRHHHPHALAFTCAHLEHRVVPDRDVLGRWKVRRRREPEGSENGCDVTGHADAVTRAEPRRIHLLPVGAAAARVKKVRVTVDERLTHVPAVRSSWIATKALLAAASMSRIASSSCASDAKL